MISIWGTTISATSPLFLLGIPLGAALLVYIFRARGTGATVVTSTLYLLSKLPQYMPARRRFIPPLQFWIELLAVVLLSFAAAGLLSSETGSRIAIVLDTSKSMATLTATSESRLAIAKRLAAADIAQSLPTTRFSVFAASDTLKPIADAKVSSAAAIRAVTGIEQGHSTDALGQLVTALTNSREYNRIWVYTDKTSEAPSTDTALKIISIPSDTTTLTNVWIHALTTKRVGTQTFLEAEFLASTATPLTTSITTTCTQPASNESFTLPALSATISPGQITKTSLGPISQPWRYCRISVQPTHATTTDALSIDNEGWVASTDSTHSILLVSALTPEQLGLQSIPGITVSAASTTATPSASQVIYHRQAPQTVPDHATLTVMPPPGTLPWRGGAVSAPHRGTTEITRWATSHPIMQYVQPGLLSLPAVSVLECPESATPVLFSSLGPVACAGEEAGARYVITGFELFPFDGMKSPTLSVLTLNTIKWLFQSGQTSTAAPALGSIKLPTAATAARILAPQPKPLTPDANRSVLVTEPSVLSITTSANGDSIEQVVACNAISDSESDTSKLGHITHLPSGDTAPTKPQEKHPLEGILAAAALIVLTADLIRRIITRSSWGHV